MTIFYTNTVDMQLRFGDVVQGGIAVSLILKHSQSNCPAKEYSLTSLDINNPLHSVIITPCCSIGKENRDKISIVPLTPIKSSFVDNPYFAEDLLRINKEIEPEKSMPPDIWDKLSIGEKQKRLNVGKTFALINYFVYASNDLLPKYKINYKKGVYETNLYMIDFTDIIRIQSEKLTSPENTILKSKLLQLSVSARNELKNKIKEYYCRIPKEDEINE